MSALLGSSELGQAVGFESFVSGGRAHYSYIWDFGDPQKLPYQNPVWYSTRAGAFTVRLTVTDAQGRTGSASVMVAVSP